MSIKCKLYYEKDRGYASLVLGAGLKPDMHIDRGNLVLSLCIAVVSVKARSFQTFRLGLEANET